ncbi:hypothetical protein JIN80_12215 [Cerasicoccus arenae]|nr:hypothetical protein [Cerasicoccus arenae]
MKRRHTVGILLTIMVIVPFLVNLTGWNMFVYLQVGDRDLIAASSRGSAHFAVSEHIEDSLLFGMVEELEWHKILFEAGPIEIFAEKPGEPLQMLTFRVISQSEFSDYSGIEFPWLLFLLFPIGLFAFGRERKLVRRGVAGNAGDD